MCLSMIVRAFGYGWKEKDGYGQVRMYGLSYGQTRQVIGYISRLSITKIISSIILQVSSEKFPGDQ